jgi:hypothetical protein
MIVTRLRTDGLGNRGSFPTVAELFLFVTAYRSSLILNSFLVYSYTGYFPGIKMAGT